jgi:hypothetical protein
VNSRRCFASRFSALAIVAVAAVVFAAPAAARDKGQPKTQHVDSTLTARCAGDTVSGQVSTDAPAGTAFTLTLLQQQTKKAAFVPTGKSYSFTTSARQKSYPYAFNVSALSAWAYRVTGAGKDRDVLSASCAPGHQVPEASFSLLLPLSVLAVFGIPAAVRRRRPAA